MAYTQDQLNSMLKTAQGNGASTQDIYNWARSNGVTNDQIGQAYTANGYNIDGNGVASYAAAHGYGNNPNGQTPTGNGPAQPAGYAPGSQYWDNSNGNPNSANPLYDLIRSLVPQMGQAQQASGGQINYGPVDVNNPYLKKQADAIEQGVTDNYLQNIAPQLRSSAIAAGGYGGSRSGIAEGLATAQANKDIAGQLSNLYGGAYENANNRYMQGQIAQGGFDTQANLANANNSMQTNLANQNSLIQGYGLWNQNQANMQNYKIGQANINLGQQAQNLNQSNSNNNWALQGQRLLNDQQNQRWNQNMQLYNLGTGVNDQGWNDAQRYASTINGSQGNSTSTGSSTSPGNPWGGAYAGYRVGQGIYNSFGNSGSSNSGFPGGNGYWNNDGQIWD